MIITGIAPVTKTRYQVFLDGQPAFCLYKGELSRYHLTEGGSLDEEVYQRICQETLLRRAKLRAMHLLNQMGRTKAQLRKKLLDGGYPEEVVDDAMAYVSSFGYVNDLEYARSFILGRKHRKSRRYLPRFQRKEFRQSGSKRPWPNVMRRRIRSRRSVSCSGKRNMIRRRRTGRRHRRCRPIW